jgi:hypothetical protein
MSPPLFQALRALVTVVVAALSEYVLGKVDNLNNNDGPKQ